MRIAVGKASIPTTMISAAVAEDPDPDPKINKNHSPDGEKPSGAIPYLNLYF